MFPASPLGSRMLPASGLRRASTSVRSTRSMEQILSGGREASGQPLTRYQKSRTPGAVCPFARVGTTLRCHQKFESMSLSLAGARLFGKRAGLSPRSAPGARRGAREAQGELGRRPRELQRMTLGASRLPHGARHRPHGACGRILGHVPRPAGPMLRPAGQTAGPAGRTACPTKPMA